MKTIFKQSMYASAALLISGLFAAQSAFGAITGVTRLGGSVECAPSLGGALVEGSQAYCDRTEPVYTYINLPAELAAENPDYIIVAVDDRDDPTYGLEVTVDFPGTILLFIEQGLDMATYMPWVAADGYANTGFTVELDKAGAFDNVIMDIYALDVTAGDILVGPVGTGPQEEPGTGSMYGVAYVTDQVDIGVAITDVPDPVVAGSGTGNFVGTFSVTNDGPNEATNVEVTLNSSGVTDGTIESFDVPAGTSFNGSVWSIPSLDPAVTLDLPITITIGLNQTTGTDVITWTSNVTAVDQQDANGDNDSATEMTSVDSASDLPVGFATSIVFTNGNTGTVTATLTCNAGLPLSQEFDISEGSGVNFSMTNLPFTTPGTTCEIAIDGVESGYMASGVANGGAAADSCMFDSTTFDPSGANTCVFTAEPMATMVEVNTTIDTDDPTIGSDFETVIACMNVSPDTGPTFIDVTVTDTSGSFMANWYADPVNGTDCAVTLVGNDSAIEGDSCEFSFDIGDEAAGCDVEGTVFFEGIPTLSQYGMAIMALLMLGIGFVGMRRFV